MSKKRVLDRGKAYALITGSDPHLHPNTTYQQNGLYFDHHGNEVGGEYIEVDDSDRAAGLAAENDSLKAKLAEMERKLTAQESSKDAKDYDRDAIVERLKAMNVDFDGRTGTDKLYQLLQDKIDEEES